MSSAGVPPITDSNYDRVLEVCVSVCLSVCLFVCLSVVLYVQELCADLKTIRLKAIAEIRPGESACHGKKYLTSSS